MKAGKIGLPIIEMPEHPLQALSHYNTRVHLNFHRAVSETAIGQEILGHLASDCRATRIAGAMISKGTSAIRLELANLAAWWLWRANDVGRADAKLELDSFLDSDEIETLSALWVYGPEPTQTLELINGVFLIPLDDMIASSDKEQFLQAKWQPSSPFPVPSAALVKQHRIKKIYPSSSERIDFSVSQELEHIALLLNCLAGIFCTAAYQTSYSPESVPLGPFGGWGGGSTLHDVVPRSSCKIKGIDQQLFASIVSAFRDFNSQARERVMGALQRIRQAKGRLDFGERALDLGIALEMLLLGPEHRKKELPDQLSLHFRLRGSWLVGSSIEERIQIYSTLREIYSYRSKIAHNGFSKELASMDHSKREEMLSKHVALAERILQRVIIKGFPEDWTTIVLGANAHMD